MDNARNLIDYELTGLDLLQVPMPVPLPAGILLRPADLIADLQVLHELCQAAFGPPPGSVLAGDDVLPCAEVAGLIRHPGLAPPGVFVALDGELPVGMVVGRIEVPAAGGGARRAAVELLAVRPGYRQRGIARALLGQVLAWLAERSVDSIAASTDNPIVATMLEAHGFRARTAD